MSQMIVPKTYETDFYQWTREQAQGLREFVNTHHELKHLEALDWENIIEEIEALGRSEYNSVVSSLLKQIEHLLKIDYVPLEECHKKWKVEVLAFKKNLKRKFAPSMKPKLEKELEDIFQDAAELVAFEYEIDLPNQCPYRLDDLL
jgi:hypothetical protein